MLRAGVGVGGGPAQSAVHAGRRYDAPPPIGDHHSCGVFRPQKHAGEVYVDDTLELGQLAVQNVGFWSSGDPGVVEHDV